MTEPRDPGQPDIPIDPATQTHNPAPPDAAQPPNAGVAYGRTGTYSPPYESRMPWAAPGWSQQTPQHWLEPLPGQDRRRRQGGRSGPYLVMIIFVALIAGAVGSAGTYLALLYGGGLSTSSLSSQASPQPTLAPQSSAQTVIVDEQTAITEAAEAVSPAVVTITVRSGAATDPFSLPETGVGSGIIYDASGWVLTNRHVVADATQVTVELQDGRRLPGSVYGVDTLTDLAIVKIDATGLTAARIGDSGALKPGQTAIVIGSPLGTFTNSVTSGVISALGRELVVTDPVTGERRQLRNLVQTDAAINPGNSGGPLVDAAGRVVGVSTAFAESAQGIFFAIPINIAKPIMRQAIAGKPLSRPWIGIVYVTIDRNAAEENDLPIDYGAWIAPETADGKPPIWPDSPATTAGLKANDIITSIDGQRIDAAQGVDDILSLYEPGDRLTLSVLREGATLSMGLTLGTRPADLE
ncbi:MAG: trypsin-like peptidase domain-containing protein [Chloroflexota bacterium]